MTAPRPVVLVPFATHIVRACEKSLRELENRDYDVRRFASTAAVDRARCDMVTRALDDGAEEILWIDSDVAFEPDSVETLRAHALPLVAGIYPKKGIRQFAAELFPGTPELKVGDGGGLVEFRYVGFGFVFTRRCLYQDIQKKFALPVCNEQYAAPCIPFFLPMVHADPAGSRYLGEDYAFCERARRAGHRVMVDSTIRLGHVGQYTYGWEDVGAPVARVTGARFGFDEKDGESGGGSGSG